MTRIEREKLKWKCRRGLLELDIVLERYQPHLKDVVARLRVA
jgi:succinate dehydrogenase flavin-adding protein (antitoxin of CptAB toxin-antitoxin module)